MFRPSKNTYIALLLLFSVFLSACVGVKRVPNLERIFAATKAQKGKRPVIIIPGILGSELENAETKESIWVNLSLPKSDGLSLPISPDLSKNRDSLTVKGIIKKVNLSRFLPEVSIYQALTDSMEKYGGYTEGDWENPDTENGGLDKYYIFAYDWRRDNVENAQLLVRKIEELKTKLGKADLRFNVIAHSMGGLIARYAAMYGDKDLPLNGGKPAPDWAGAKHFNKIFMFGTPNEGSMQALEVVLKGYTIAGFYINNLNAEAIITSPAIFQLLPHQSTARFYDENLKPIEVDLYNPQTWKEYGWSAYTNPSFLNKFAGQPNAVDKSGKKSEFADVSLEELDEYFAAVLKRAKNFHEALDANTAVPPSISFFAFGSDCGDTLDGALIIRNAKTKQWQTFFTSRSITTSEGKKITKAAVREILFAPGDTRVTRRSLLAETILQENYRNSIFRKSLPVNATFFCELHDELPNNKIVQNNFLTALISEIIQ
jgi:pimeloyl-ACP methyl ester carboxylesterase